MKVAGRAMRTIWLAADGRTVEIIDQTRLPHELAIVQLRGLEEAARAIRDMQVRGAPLIGAAAAYGVALALLEDASDKALDNAVAVLAATRPTAVNLRWALDDMRRHVGELPPDQRFAAAVARAGAIIREALARSEGCRLHLENTAGTGGTLGRSFAELGQLIEAAGGGKRLRVCLDSCHLLASGYDIRTADGLGGVLDQFDAVVGLDRLMCADPGAGLPPSLASLMRAVSGGRDTLAALAGTPDQAQSTLAALTELELQGRLRRVAGGRYVVVPRW
jgi:hypothetical protein